MTSYQKYLFWLVVLLLTIVLALVISEVGQRNHYAPEPFVKDTLYCVIGDNRGDYFIYRAEPVGYQLEMIRNFANVQGAKYKIEIVPDLSERVQKLLADKADIMICNNEESAVYLQNDTLTDAFILRDSSAWVVKSENTALIIRLNQWLANYKVSNDYRFHHQYYFQSLIMIRAKSHYLSLSPYDDLIKKYAHKLGWDWRLLAALICQESRFNPEVESNRGAYGLMQILPSTAESLGFPNIEEPETNIAAGIKYLQFLEKNIKLEDTSKVNQQKFILAAYNAGIGRIEDCRAFADSQGLNSDNWDEVASVIPLMRHEIHYNSETIQRGRFKGTETLNFVVEVWDRYEHYLNLVAE